MKSCKPIALLFALILISGCASAPLNHDVSQDLRSKNIAVAFYQKEKEIDYNEQVYKVLWLESRQKDASFEGIWDIDTDLSKHITPLVAQLGLNATCIYDVLPAAEIERFHSDVYDSISFDKELSIKPWVLNENTRKALLEKNIDYLITVVSPNIYIYTQIGVKQGSVRTCMHVLDVKANEQKYYDVLYAGGLFKVEENVREIEDNDLAQLKGMIKDWLALSISNNMPKQLGLAQAN